MKKGFTLIELLVVFAIIAILISVALVATGVGERFRDYDSDIEDSNIESEQTPEEICIKRGGIPLGSNYRGEIQDCKFPPIGGEN